MKVTTTQLEILKQDVEAWNKWRRWNPDIVFDLSGANLTKSNLERADFSRMNLSGVDFQDANLTRANFSGSNLSGANLRGATLLLATLVDADFTGVNFIQTILGHANFTDANLTGANLAGMALDFFTFDGCNLTEVDLSETKVTEIGPSFIKANLTRANLTRAKLKKATFTAANLFGAVLKEADLSEAHMPDADLTEADLTGVTFALTFLARANLTRANLTRAQFWVSNLMDSNLTEAILDEVVFTATDLRGTILSQGEFDGVKFERPEEEFPTNDEFYPEIYAETDIEEETLLKESPISIVNMPDKVSFTAIFPKEAEVETWHTFLFYAHLKSAFEAVRKDAQRYKDQIPAPKEITSQFATPILRGTTITIVPFCDGLTFNPDRVAFQWMEEYHCADFRFMADKSLVNDAARGEINIFVGPINVGVLKFAMLVSETEVQDAKNQEAYGEMYHQEDIFVSYSHKDTDIVQACKKAYDALGFNVLIDIDTLRSGQVWNDELMRMIDRATIFQLFWSRNSSQSKYCRQEWEHALKKNKDGFIRPVYWKAPMPDPPPELSRLHFAFVEFDK